METANQQHPEHVLYFNDLYVGQKFISGTHQLDAEQVIKYAREFDPQPFHTDPEAAKGTFFQGLVASGWHTASITMRLMTESGLNIAGGIIGAGVEVNWPRPTQPDSLLQVFSEIIETRPSRSRPDRGMATIRCETRDQLGAIVQVMTAKLVVPLRPVG